jgi:hypothetical protein
MKTQAERQGSVPTWNGKAWKNENKSGIESIIGIPQKNPISKQDRIAFKH